MAAKAYILIRTAPGLTKAISSALRISPIVRSVETITGKYDLIAVIEANTTDEILATVMKHIRPAAGVRDTVTYLVVPGDDLE
ncbi:MAG: Lrp/AsnC ligand binding domain-containing protein [Anaerolineae bacterium]|jgi:DNA-binding Lrp family transcriptional regulator